MNWLSTSLRNINDDLHILEANKKKEQEQEKRNKEKTLLTRDLFKGDLSDSKAWSLTLKEKTALELMEKKLHGYTTQHLTQKRVLSYLETKFYRDQKYKKIVDMSYTNASKDINKYIKASAYWIKRSINLDGKNKTSVKWVFAINEDMQSVICRYREWFIVTTISSHENIMREIEGKAPIYPIQWDEPNQRILDPIEEILNQLQ